MSFAFFYDDFDASTKSELQTEEIHNRHIVYSTKSVGIVTEFIRDHNDWYQ